VRDGVVARATHDFLFAFRHGQVSATLDLLSVDLQTRSVVITRNAQSPMLIRDLNGCRIEMSDTAPIGVYEWTKPSVRELPIQGGLRILLFTDGVTHSGLRRGAAPIDFLQLANDTMSQDIPAQAMADAVHAFAVQRDQGRSSDDLAIVALSIDDREEPAIVRRMQAQIPLP
jgi:serine phosphatase RsbU (regulator of sigma subunit)